MSDSLFNHGVNVVAYEKNGTKYAATIAWGMQAGYNEILLLIGSQSDTGNNIKKGQIIGISALAKDQMKIAEQLGEHHSKNVDKLKEIDYKEEKMSGFNETAIVINGAKNQMIAQVIDVMHLEGIEEDNLIYGKVLKNIASEKSFLSMSDF